MAKYTTENHESTEQHAGFAALDAEAVAEGAAIQRLRIMMFFNRHHAPLIVEIPHLVRPVVRWSARRKAVLL